MNTWYPQPINGTPYSTGYICGNVVGFLTRFAALPPQIVAKYRVVSGWNGSFHASETSFFLVHRRDIRDVADIPEWADVERKEAVGACLARLTGQPRIDPKLFIRDMRRRARVGD